MITNIAPSNFQLKLTDFGLFDLSCTAVFSPAPVDKRGADAIAKGAVLVTEYREDLKAAWLCCSLPWTCVCLGTGHGQQYGTRTDLVIMHTNKPV